MNSSGGTMFRTAQLYATLARHTTAKYLSQPDPCASISELRADPSAYATKYANDPRVVEIVRVLTSLEETDPSRRKRDELYLMARMARKARRYEDMVMIINELMTAFCVPADSSSHAPSDPTWKELGLLDQAYEGFIRELMKEWRSASDIVLDDELERARYKGRPGAMDGDDEDEDDEAKRKKRQEDEEGRHRREQQMIEAKERRMLLEGKIREAVHNLIRMGDAIMEGRTAERWFSDEMKLRYMKMRTDRAMDLVMITPIEQEKEALLLETEEAYETAYAKAKEALSEVHIVRLGLAHNLAKLYRYRGWREKAMKLCHEAFNDAVMGLDSICEDYYRKVCFVLQNMRDDLSLWLICDSEPDDIWADLDEAEALAIDAPTD